MQEIVRQRVVNLQQKLAQAETMKASITNEILLTKGALSEAQEFLKHLISVAATEKAEAERLAAEKAALKAAKTTKTKKKGTEKTTETTEEQKAA